MTPPVDLSTASNEPSATAAPRPATFDIAVRLQRGDPAKRLTVVPESSHDLVGDLAAALGASVDRALVIDGQVVAAEVALVDSGIRNGSVVETDAHSDAASSVPCAPNPAELAPRGGAVEVACVVGPDCRSWMRLGPGRHVIGRASTAAIVLDDPRVELHHALLDVDDEGCRLTQLTGRAPLRLDDEPISGTRPVVGAAVLSIGSSELWFGDGLPGDGAGAGDADAGDRVDGDGHVDRRWQERLAGRGTVVEAATDPWRRLVHRAPEPITDPTANGPIRLPVAVATHRAPPATALIGAAVGVLGAGAIAVVAGQMMFALFAVFGAVASAVTWLAGAAHAWRENRRSRHAAAVDRQRFLDELMSARRAAEGDHRRRHTEVHVLLDEVAPVTNGRSDVWCRRRTVQAGRASFRVVLGRGSGRWNVALDADPSDDVVCDIERAAVFHDVPVAVELTDGDVVTVVGEQGLSSALVRSILCQLAVQYGPADWRLVVVSADPDAWAWAEWLPHARAGVHRPGIVDPSDAAEFGRTLAAAEADPTRTTVLVCDDSRLFAVRTGSLRRFVDRVSPVTLISLPGGASAPAVSRATIGVGATGRIDLTDFGGATWPVAPMQVAMSGVSDRRVADAARTLACLVDPEDASTAATRLPDSVALGDLDAAVAGAGTSDDGMAAAVASVCRRWRLAGEDPAPCAAIGRSADGVVEIDLVGDGPHALIAGTTGAGKSELLRTLVTALALRHRPDQLNFVLVDYKGGATFDRCAELPHTVGLVTDLDDGLAARALVSLDAELHRRETLLRRFGAADLSAYRRQVDAPALARLVVVIDEFAALARELPDFLAALIGVAQRGRSLGIHLVLATQRPAGVVNDEIRANTNLRLALRLHDRTDANDVVGDSMPATFSRDAPGRAALRLGPDELVVFQAAHCSGRAQARTEGLTVRAAQPAGDAGDRRAEAPTELDVAVVVVNAAARRLAAAAPHRPWIDPLPERVTRAMVDLVADAVDHGGVGIVDDPAEQCRRVLRWNRDLGHLALVGALGSGTTSTLRAVVADRCCRRSPACEHWYVIDARGDGSLPELASFPHVAAVVRAQEAERIHRVLARLVDEIDRRAAGSPTDRCVSLAVDGLSSLYAALSAFEHAATLALLERVLADGPAAGVVCCWTDDGILASRVAVAAESWVFRCDSADVARQLGVAPVVVEHPGRLRIASCGREAHVTLDAGQVPPTPSAGWRTGSSQGPAPVEALPTRVSQERFAAPPSGRVSRNGLVLDVGLAYDDLRPAALQVPFGDHVLIAGAASVGKSSVLAHLTEMWRIAHPDGSVVRLARGDRLPSNLSEHGPLLIAVDDAERVDDVDGRLAATVAAGAPDVLIAAAVRLEAVRTAYGHWTREVARSRCGLIFTAAGEVDGDVLGVALPRRTPVPARPGLAWVIDGTGHRLAQLVDVQASDASPSNHLGPAPN